MSQLDVDMLAYSRCAELDGSLFIKGSVRDLRPLAGLRAISGQLSVRSAKLLLSLNGLEGLEKVGVGSDGWPSQSLVITDSPAIESIAALRNVRVLPGGLYLENNIALETLAGLENVSKLCTEVCMDWAITVKNSPGLRNFSALRSARGLLKGLMLAKNWGLTSLDGLQGFTGLAIGCYIANNVMLESLEPLAGATSGRRQFGLELNIFDNPRLVSLDGLSGIRRCHQLCVVNNARLQSLAPLRSVSGPVRGDLKITMNEGLQDLHGLEGITSVKSLTVSGNTALRTLAALSGIRGTLGGSLVVQSNANLRSLHGLHHITGVGVDIRPPKEQTVCLEVKDNSILESVHALAGISGIMFCSTFFRQQRPLASFEIFTGATMQGQLFISPAPLCFPTRERDRLLYKFLNGNGWWAVVPLPHWEDESCRECPPCGVQDGLAVSCDMSSGRCRCPLGWMGENCSSPAPRIAVLPQQRYFCTLPRSGSLVECTVQIALRRALGAGISMEPHSVAVHAIEAGALSMRETNGSAHPIAWVSETDGTISVTLLSTFSNDDVPQSLRLRVGYVRDSQPAQYLEGTLPRNSSALEDTVFPWCLDSGDCVQFAPQRILVQTCPYGSVPSADNTRCTSCGMFRKGTNGECDVDLLLAAAFVVVLACLLTLATQVDGIEVCALAVHFRSRRLMVHDVSRDGGRVVVSTWGQHHFHMWIAKSFPIRFKGTGCRSLDAPKESFRARVIALDQLELLDSTGKSLQAGDFDSSMGVVQLPLHRTIMQTGWPLPLAFSVPALSAASLVMMVYASSISQDEILVLVALALASSLGGMWLQRQRIQQTPLARRLGAYDARRPNRQPKQTKRGEDRAISAGQLVDFDGYFQEFIRSRSMYYVVANIVKPLTAACQLSFAEYIGPSRLVWFASHFWGTEFRHFCSSIRRHANTVGDPASQSYWICSFSINQHCVEEEVGSDYRESSFYLALQSSDCSGTCMVIDEEALPLTRSWCLFELLQTIEVEGWGAGRFQGLFFCTSTGVLNSGHASMETSMALGRRLATLRLEDASASVEADKVMIDGLVESKMGGFEGMNRALRSRISAALRASKEQAWRDFEALEMSLTA